MANELWYIGRNNEWLNEGPFDSREQAISEGRHQYEGEKFYIGVRAEIHALDPVSLVETLFDHAANQVYDEAGSDAADNWPERRNQEAMRDAGQKIRAIFMELYGEPTVFRIESSELIEATKVAHRKEERGCEQDER